MHDDPEYAHREGDTVEPPGATFGQTAAKRAVPRPCFRCRFELRVLCVLRGFFLFGSATSPNRRARPRVRSIVIGDTRNARTVAGPPATGSWRSVQRWRDRPAKKHSHNSCSNACATLRAQRVPGEARRSRTAFDEQMHRHAADEALARVRRSVQLRLLHVEAARGGTGSRG